MKFFDKTELLIFAIFFLVYLIFIHWNGYNENSRFALTRAIVDEHRLEIDTFANQTSDRAYFDGHYYSDKDPGLSLLATIPYSIFKIFFYKDHPATSQIYFTNKIGTVEIYDVLNLDEFTLHSMIIVTVFTSVLLSALTVVLIYKITKFFTSNQFNRLLITFTAGFATTIFVYASIFMDSAASTFFLIAGFYLLLKKNEHLSKQNKYLFLSGLCFGLSILMNILNLFITLFSFAYLWFLKKTRMKGLLIFILGCLLTVSIYSIYDTLAFKAPAISSRYYLDKNVWFKEVYTTAYSLPIPSPYILWRLLFDPSKGVFFYYPVLLFSIYGLWLMYKKMKHEAILIFSVFAFIVIFNSGLSTWWGGAVFGPRYLTDVIPFFLIPSIFVLDKKSKFIKILFIVLLAYSTIVNFSSLQPKVDEFSGTDRVSIADKYKSKVNSFEILANPIYDYYMPRLFEFGPRSRLIENLINRQPLDIRFITPESREPFVPFSKETITFVSGWQHPQPNEKVIWMIKDGKINVENMYFQQTNQLTFSVGANYEDKHLKIFVNGKLFNETAIPKDQPVFYTITNLPYGKNTLMLQTLETCKIPNLTEGKEDRRCLNIYVDGVRFIL